jgi:hypothetical protein
VKESGRLRQVVTGEGGPQLDSGGFVQDEFVADELAYLHAVFDVMRTPSAMGAFGGKIASYLGVLFDWN